ncbi:MAG: hypothetical protein K9W42_11530 [Candidatus Heimdallarchaeota archaeon]|nr:hypothetical protein [Candidatus Heimdallarchaeota archaeon]
MAESEKVVDSSKLGAVFTGAFKIYFRKFPILFIISFLVELAFFGIFQLVEFEFGLIYNLVIDKMIFKFEINFASNLGKASFIILVFVATLLFILRMNFISNITILTTERKQGKVFSAFESTAKKLGQNLLFMLVILTIAVFPILLFILAILIQPRLYFLAWMFFLVAMLFPFFLVFKFSHFVPGLTKDNLHVGAALQKSWSLTSNTTFFSCFGVFLTFFTISILAPWIATFYLEQTVHYLYIGILLALLRAFFYPLFDIAITLNYIHLEFTSVEKSVFREEIKKQKELSEKLVQYWTKRSD